MSVNISFRCPDELYSALLEYKTDDDKNISAALLRLMQSVLTISTDVVESKVDERKPTDYMTEGRFDEKTADIVTHFQGIFDRLSKLEAEMRDQINANDYLHTPLYPLIEEPALLNLFKDPETQEQLILFLERLKEPNASRTINIIPEVLPFSNRM